MSFDFVPSATAVPAVRVRVIAGPTDHPGVLGVGVTASGDVPDAVGLPRETLTEWGFTGKPGQVLVVPRADGTRIAVGTGDEPSAADLRDAAAAFARAAGREAVLATTLDPSSVPAADAAAAVVEGAILGRYRYDELRSEPDTVALEELVLVVDPARVTEAEQGAARGHVLARAAAISRDLASAPGSTLTAPDLADVAVRLGEAAGLEVTVHDKAALVEMGCGGLLGVNAGSVVEPRMIRISYAPDGEAEGHLGLVGKGIMYDSGGISLKPSNAMHAAMKMDMTGAGAILATMTVLRDLGVRSRVTAYLACTDNMPSGSATKLGDVLVTRSGRTIEVVNTDAEGRLVLSDAITLANEDGVDAIVDIATLTGAALAALGPLTAAVLGNDDGVVGQVETAARRTDERVWRLPLDERYRPWMDSEIADIKNLGGEFAGSITAALFLAEWVGETPWAHVDIAGPMRSDTDDAWRTKGATGFGARLLAEVAAAFGGRPAPTA
ncbi:Leucyl aminopeptidase [Beutenbergia cavernae DSM 12333]|uniref:Probable cytosol aminopeptidase n=1 Tax=Beutenbergia cavernae (strain ATCC BAA-8 / DSM 12333 / CCUG 43141 / JCM 11478 / NBRC 16432 / NCIMB 13614 / HKI 0122) TaxID=471853 RepID=C5BXH4_BEUC1|nr:leucyl aminopeptidase [Beutenbergia cavernae]ACQ80857.1 Leucyl aminopeptidase [Beutenbergia cavernae DSM 12333]